MGIIDKIRSLRRVDDSGKAEEAAYLEEESRNKKQYNKDWKGAIKEDRKRSRRINDVGKAEEEAYRNEERREMSFIDRARSIRRIKETEEAEEEAYGENE